MGMDVFGVAPTTPAGEYFRNNVWWWRPLWQYCTQTAPDLTEGVSGDTNDGDGLDAAGANELGRRLQDELDSGRCALYAAERDHARSGIVRERCGLCDGTGVRRDAVGVANGMPERPLDEATSIILGRASGWCNGCGGEGERDGWELAYQFSTENVAAFAAFCSSSGGFRIC